MTEKEFQCPRCNKRVQTTQEAEAPQCCEQPMVDVDPMAQCTLASTPEHARLDDPGEPCDDGRAG